MQEAGSTECIFNVSEKIQSNYKVYWHLAAVGVIACFISLPAVCSMTVRHQQLLESGVNPTQMFSSS